MRCSVGLRRQQVGRGMQRNGEYQSRTTTNWACPIEARKRPTPRTPLQTRHAISLATLLLWGAVVSARAADAAKSDTHGRQESQGAIQSVGTAYEGKTVLALDLPGVSQQDRDHLLQLISQKVGTPLTRDGVRDSIRVLYETGRFADIQAEVTPSADGIVLTFATSPNFFVGAVNV